MNNFLNEEILIKIAEIVSAIMMVITVIVYGLAAYWNFKYIFMTKWAYYSRLKLYTALISVGFVIVFGFLFVNYITGHPIDISYYGGLIIRPFVLMMGAVTASSARARIISLNIEKEQNSWIPRV